MELNIRNESHLLEVTRKDLVTKSRVQSKDRFKKRLNYQVSNFRGVDLKQMFENDYFVFKTPIKDYVCVIAFPGVFSQLRKVVKETHGDVHKINLQMVIKALRRAFDATDDVKVDCTCADWRYRYAYWATQNGYKYGSPETRPSDITNPDDAIGSTCKHLDLLLSNKRWLVKAASVVNSFIKAYPDKAAKYLYDEDEIVKDPEEDQSDSKNVEEVPDEKPETPEEEVPSEESRPGQESEEEVNEDEEETSEKEIKDSLDRGNLDESVVDSDEDLTDSSDNPKDKIREQRVNLVSIKNRMLKYAYKNGVSGSVEFLGYNKNARQDNSAMFSVKSKGKTKKIWVTYSDGRFVLVTPGGTSKSNADPQKIVKYVFDHLVF